MQSVSLYSFEDDKECVFVNVTVSFEKQSVVSRRGHKCPTPSSCRNIANAHQRTAQGNYSLNGLVGFEMYQKTIGIIGTGAIGYEAVRIFKVGVGCNPLCCAPLYEDV